MGIKLINSEGRTVHEWLVDREDIFSGGTTQRWNPSEVEVHGSLLLPNGDILVNLVYVGMARLNSCGEVLWTMKEGNHHSITQAEDGTFWVPGVSQEKRARSDTYPEGFPGLKGKKYG